MRLPRIGLIVALLASGWLLTPAEAQTNVWRWVNGVLYGPGFVTTGPVLNGDGTTAAPSYSFASTTGTGIWSPGVGLMTFNSTGSPGVLVGNGVFRFGSLITLGWSSGTNPNIAADDVVLSRLAADVIAPAAGDAYGLAAKAWIRTAPTISSGFGTSPSVVASNGTAAFTINVGTGGTANSGVIGLPTATTGWRVNCDDVTTQSSTVFLTKQTATSTTSATIGNFDAAGAAAAWVASNILVCSATAY